MIRIRVDVSQDGLRREVHNSGNLPSLFYEIQPRGNAVVPAIDGGDFALLAMVPIAMHAMTDLHAEFEVDSVLLDGIEHYQEVWHSWRPDLFKKKIKISTEGEHVRSPALHSSSAAVAAFSSGLDSTFTLSRHLMKDAGRSVRNIQTATMVHGFDMPLEANDGFEALAQNGLAVCRDLGVDFVTVKTNWRRLIQNWEMTFGVGLASVLHQFSKSHDVALIATEESYENSPSVWGNSFWSDRFFSSSRLKIELDGGAYDRIERARYLSRHRQLIPFIHVCYAGPRTGHNCGTCPKCILTKLNFLAAGVAEPWPFPQGLTAELIDKMPIKNPWQETFLKIILASLEQNRAVDGTITRAVRSRLKRHRYRSYWKTHFRERVASIF
jgi:hypothetical protein